MSKAELILQTYTLDELLEINDLTEEEVLTILLDRDLIRFIRPVDYDTSAE